MRKSELRTTIAVLRQITGLKADEFAALLNCSPDTVKSIENGRLALSESMATRASNATGVSIAWLLEKNPKKLPTTIYDQPYTPGCFAEHTAVKRYWDSALPVALIPNLVLLFARLDSIFKHAGRKKKPHLALYRLSNAVEELAKEFGEPDTSPRTVEAAGTAMKKLMDDFSGMRHTAWTKGADIELGLRPRPTAPTPKPGKRQPAHPIRQR